MRAAGGMTMTEAVAIGKGLYRVTVRSRVKREKLAAIPGVRVEDDRLIVGEELRGPVLNFLGRRRQKREPAPQQMEIWGSTCGR